MSVGENSTLSLLPSWTLNGGLSLSVRMSNSVVFTSSPQKVTLSANAHAAQIRVSALSSGVSRLTLSSTAPSELTLQDAVVLSSGVGYTAGTLSVQGYGGTGFSATYSVGVEKFAFYRAANGREMRGHNFRRADTMSSDYTFEGKGNGMVYGTCWAAASETLSMQGAHVVGHMGTVVAGCQPSVTVTIVNGSVDVLDFHGSDCLVTGLTCSVSLSQVLEHSLYFFVRAPVSCILVNILSVCARADACWIDSSFL